MLNWLFTRISRKKQNLRVVNQQQPLVKPRPLSLQERYRALAPTDQVEVYFRRLQHRLYREAQGGQVTGGIVPARVRPRMLRETGRIGKQRPYFFMQPVNRKGLLFERDEHGWRISFAFKIVSESTFMRDAENWDVVTLHANPDQPGAPRITSQRFGAELVSFAVYEQKMLEALGNWTVD